jgi:hypothetical protein
MALPEDYVYLRRATGEDDPESKYSNTDLDVYIDAAGGDLDLAAARIWRNKMSDYADLVDISEAGSSRKNSDLFNHAREQADYFDGISGGGDAVSTDFTRIGRIVRR